MTPRSTSPGAVRRALIVAASIAGLLLAGIGSADAATVGVAAVNFTFQPESRSVKVGDTVRWTFTGDPHTVTSGTAGSPDGRFDSGVKDPGGTFQVTFDTAGTFRYFCQVHPEQMSGTIVVTAGPAATPRPTPKPTPRPTPKPTPRPTARPTATATATARPTATADVTAAPTAVSTPAPSASTAPTASPSPTPAASATATGGLSPGPSPSATPIAGEPASGTDPLPIVVGVVVLGALLAGGLVFARRARGSP